MFADDSKLFRVINDNNDRRLLQSDLLAVCSWSRTWLMELNVKKCKFMHFATPNTNPILSYYMEEYDLTGNLSKVQLDHSTSERDLGIQITSDLKNREQVNLAAAKANRILGQFKKAFTSRNPSLWKRLYTTYVRPPLEFAIQAWSPHLAADIKVLEQIQRKATRIPHDLKRFGYETRCRKLGLTTLRERRVRGDLIQHFKFEKGFDTIQWYHPPQRGQSRRIRLHRELVKNCNSRFHWFNNRLVGSWNALPDEVTSVTSVSQFKSRLANVGNLLELNPLRLAR